MKRLMIALLILAGCGGGGGGDDSDYEPTPAAEACSAYCRHVCNKALDCLSASDPQGVCAAECFSRIIQDGNLDTYMCEQTEEQLMSLDCAQLIGVLDASMRSITSLEALGAELGII